MNNLTQNRILAEYAVSHVEAIMSKGPGPCNRSESVVHRVLPGMPQFPRLLQGPDPAPPSDLLSWGASFFTTTPWEAERKANREAHEQWPLRLKEETAAAKQKITKQLDDQRIGLKKISGGELPTTEQAILMGAEVERTGLGNCGEQSYVAFRYLITKGADGLAIMNWVGRNHTFVVIGMDPGVGPRTTATPDAPPNWGNCAVLCDPWYHEWFPIEPDSWKRKMPRIVAETLPVPEGRTETEWRFFRHVWMPQGRPHLSRMAGMTAIALSEMLKERSAHYWHLAGAMADRRKTLGYKD